VHESGRLLELGDLMALAQLDFPQLKDPPHVPVLPAALRDGPSGGAPRSMFDVIRERDLLVHHPFHSFDATVERFLEEAAADPAVLAIKTTLYRTSGDTAIVEALTDAAQAGKQVAALVELQARFDEVNNINWARTLERYGVHVAYGLPGLKTHCKTVLVVRRDPDGTIRRYCHIGPATTTRRRRASTPTSGCSPPARRRRRPVGPVQHAHRLLAAALYRKLLVAPANMRGRLMALIEREAAHARAGVRRASSRR
jgi:polyphosphate kinase